ncbi:MAG TPA: cupin domain-containing protein [Gaiellaceae bacterium]|jgi:hypothetical protein
MNEKINLAEKFALLDKAYDPATIGHFNDAKLVVALIEGEFVWHSHDDTDDFFLVIAGELTIQLRDRNIVLSPGELFVVPRGVEHLPEGGRPDPCAPHREGRNGEHRRRRRRTDAHREGALAVCEWAARAPRLAAWRSAPSSSTSTG